MSPDMHKEQCNMSEGIPTSNEAKSNCNSGQWFHASCGNVSNVETLANKDWWCSDHNCRKYTAFCCHDNNVDSALVSCTFQAHCLAGRWFHRKCIRKKRSKFIHYDYSKCAISTYFCYSSSFGYVGLPIFTFCKQYWLLHYLKRILL